MTRDAHSTLIIMINRAKKWRVKSEINYNDRPCLIKRNETVMHVLRMLSLNWIFHTHLHSSLSLTHLRYAIIYNESFMNNELQFWLIFSEYLSIQGSDPTRITTRAKLQTRRCKLNQVIHIISLLWWLTKNAFNERLTAKYTLIYVAHEVIFLIIWSKIRRLIKNSVWERVLKIFSKRQQIKSFVKR